MKEEGPRSKRALFFIKKGKPYAMEGGGWNTLRSIPQECQNAAKKSVDAALRAREAAGKSRLFIAGSASFDDVDCCMFPLKMLIPPESGGLDKRFFITCTH